MNARLALAALAIFGAPFCGAQNVSTGEPQVDPVLDAIQKFNELDKQEKIKEVTVVLDPVDDPTAPASQPPAAEETAPEPTSKEPLSPVLVTGKPPEGAEATSEPSPPPAAPDPETTAAEETPRPQDGLSVRVEKLQTGKGNIDPAQVKLLAPFPAKPLGPPPAGWHLDASDSAPPFTREVEIVPGTKVTLTIHPHLLVPDADGANVFTIPEPGYDTTLGYQQTATVGAILSNSIRQLEEDSKRLGTAIDNLQQLLVSLPKPEEPQPEVKPATNRKR